MNRFNLKSNGLVAGEDWYKYGMDFFNGDKLIVGVYYDDEDMKDNRFNIVVNSYEVSNPLKELSNDEEWLDHGYNMDCLWGHKHSIQGKLTEEKIEDYIFNKFIPQYEVDIL